MINDYRPNTIVKILETALASKGAPLTKLVYKSDLTEYPDKLKMVWTASIPLSYHCPSIERSKIVSLYFNLQKFYYLHRYVHTDLFHHSDILVTRQVFLLRFWFARNPQLLVRFYVFVLREGFEPVDNN